MVLSNKERQALYRSRLKARSALLDQLIAGWRANRESLLVQLEMLETLVMRVHSNGSDDTAQSLKRVQDHIASYDELIAQYALDHGGDVFQAEA